MDRLKRLKLFTGWIFVMTAMLARPPVALAGPDCIIGDGYSAEGTEGGVQSDCEEDGQGLADERCPVICNYSCSAGTYIAYYCSSPYEASPVWKSDGLCYCQHG